jgi:hypothetical protein
MAARFRRRPAALGAMGGLILGLVAAAGATAAASTAGEVGNHAQPARSSTAAQTGAPATTRSLSPAQYPSTGGRFYSVAATSADDVWAVGLTSSVALVWHWNGSSWQAYPFSQDDYLLGVSAQSPADVWAVGGTYWFFPTQTVAYHWNGRTLSRVRTPTPGGTAYLTGVAATSPTNAWAVGVEGGGPGVSGFTIPLIEHWNGKSWSQQSFPLPYYSGGFNGVSATGPDDAWAVGTTGVQAPNYTLIEHWNGKQWLRVRASTPHGYGNLQGVDAVSADDVWAVGFSNTGPTPQSLILHWNGKRWSTVPSPNPTGSTDLWRVSATSASNAWAVGYTNPSGCYCGTAAFHWDGKTWKAVPSPNPPASYLDAFLGVVAITPDDAWAVGTTDWASTIIEHWNGKDWQS